ncbi:MAG: ACP S-malonyltransferase, partial [Bacteroidales bacterium]|nr:ACP S-malonyltransferase [Bacteroidales bacterium]
MKTAYVFPGQGSQFSGMGKDLYESSPKAKALFEKADEILGFKISEIMFGGTEDQLKETKVTQPAVFLHSVISALCLPDFKPDMVAGHSLGEFSALAAAGAIEFEDALRLVAIRAREMQLCCDKVPGTMAAIIGLEDKVVEDICQQTEGIVIPANYNSDGQVVISGEKEAVQAACAKFIEAGAKRALPLNVSGAFHSPLMEPARAALGEAIE